MNVTGGKTHTPYVMGMNPEGTARTFTTKDGRVLTEAQMKALEGDWTQAQEGPSGQVQQGGGSLSGASSKFVPDQYSNPSGASATPTPGLGELAKRLATPQQQPSPMGNPQASAPTSAPTPQKTSDLGSMNGLASLLSQMNPGFLRSNQQMPGQMPGQQDMDPELIKALMQHFGRQA